MFFDIPKSVLDLMTKDEVRTLVVGLRVTLDAFEAWNEDRREAGAKLPPWQVAAPPNSADDYGRLRSR